MQPIGTRPYYVIFSASKYDELNLNVWFITTNKKEAIARFNWLYKEWVCQDYRNDEGEIYAEHSFNLYANDPNHPEEVTGNFYFYEDDGELEYQIKTMHTNVFSLWAGRENNNNWEIAYNEYIHRQ